MHAGRVLETGPPQEIRGGYPDLEEAMIARIQAVEDTAPEDNFAA
jgi:hypothetical protein